MGGWAIGCWDALHEVDPKTAPASRARISYQPPQLAFAPIVELGMYIIVFPHAII